MRTNWELTKIQITKALALLRNDLAYSSIQRIVEILSLSNLDPAFVQEAACDFGVLAESGGKGKGKGRGAHLTTKVGHSELYMTADPTVAACAKALELPPAQADRGRQGYRGQGP